METTVEAQGPVDVTVSLRGLAINENDIAYAAANEIERLRNALRQVAQALAWQCFGECRSYGSDVPLLQPREADALAKATLPPNT